MQLADCDVVDEDLRALADYAKLQGIGLNGANVTDVGLKYLASLPRLNYMELEDTSTSTWSQMLRGAESR